MPTYELLYLHEVQCRNGHLRPRQHLVYAASLYVYNILRVPADVHEDLPELRPACPHVHAEGHG